MNNVRHQTEIMLICASLISMLLGIGACSASTRVETGKEIERPMSDIRLVPRPSKVDVNTGVFLLTENTVIVADSLSSEERRIAHYLADVLDRPTGFKLKVKTDEQPSAESSIILTTKDTQKSLGNEGYEMMIEPQKIVIRAAKPAGLFYGVQTLRQLFPPEIIGNKLSSRNTGWPAPCVHIQDSPRYQWRGMLLDVGRHFMPVDGVKRYIDLLALHKMNVLHWHLTEDQGWRIEIKKYPKLTEIGAWRTEENGDRYGGFYTQEQIRDIVKYARDRYITIVPEIEMPGHSLGALASYPELSCTGGPFTVSNHWGVFPDVYCAGNEGTFKFLEDVLTEVMGLFPGKFIHIGGDECPKDRWRVCPKCQARIKSENLKDEFELQSYFIKRIDKFLTSKGKRLIGWDEILEGGLAPNAAVMSWRGIEGGIAAANTGHDVVMTPTSHCYLDYGQTGYETLRNVYSFEPTPAELNGALAKHVLGAQGNVWTESIPNQDRADYQIFPRLCALSEVVWSPKEIRNWDDFQARMKVHYIRLDQLQVKYYVPENPQ